MDEEFESWARWVFDHPVAASGETAWYHAPDATAARPRAFDPETDPATALAFLTRLFRGPAFLVGRYSADQIGQGLWFLADPSCSSHMFAFRNAALAASKRRQAIGAIHTLYELLFRQICDPVLGHLDRSEGSGRLANAICYMFWDLAPLGPTGEADHDRLCLQTIARTLEIPHVACQEAALHGFEHWGRVDTTLTENAIAGFLARRDLDGHPDLRAYAESVRP